jgi:hypothetical protein
MVKMAYVFQLNEHPEVSFCDSNNLRSDLMELHTVCEWGALEALQLLLKSASAFRTSSKPFRMPLWQICLFNGPNSIRVTVQTSIHHRRMLACRAKLLPDVQLALLLVELLLSAGIAAEPPGALNVPCCQCAC